MINKFNFAFPNCVVITLQVKLIIVDSIVLHFRHNFDDLSLRTRILTTMTQIFIRLTTIYKLAVSYIDRVTQENTCSWQKCT